MAHQKTERTRKKKARPAPGRTNPDSAGIGTGVRPTASGRVNMHYHCYLPNGTVIDSSVLRGEPFTAYLNQMIAGMSEGLLLMREGSKYRFTVPSDLAYGQNGVPPTIGPNQTLMFDIELLEVIP